MTDEELKEYLRLLSDKGPQVVIITSVPVHDEPHKTSVYAYNRQGNRYWKVTCPYLPAHYPGTGDTFTSVITGSLMQGDSLPMALDRATQFILQGIRATFGYEYDNREGILLEKVLQLAGAVPEVGEVVAVAGVAHFTEQGCVLPLRRTYCQHDYLLFNPPVWQVIVTFGTTDAKS